MIKIRPHEIEVDVTTDEAQQMILRNLNFEAEVVKQRPRAEMVSHHEQQASERGDEQQHPELWPAYSVNSPALQESTQGLFQQTRLISTVTGLLAAARIDGKMHTLRYEPCSPSNDRQHHRL